MDKMKATYEVMLGLAAEMVWDEALRKRRSDILHREIDTALATGDEMAFRNLTEELKSLHKEMRLAHFFFAYNLLNLLNRTKI